MAERFDVSRNGASLTGERWPGGRQTVVLLHEGVSDRLGWAEVAELLAPDLTVVAYDRRGYGDLDASFLVDRCRLLAERLPAARHHVLVGMAHQPYLESPGTVAELIRAAVAGG